MGMLYESLPIREPYSEAALAELQAAWEKEKARLVDSDVTLPRNVEALARRVFFDGYIAAMNHPPF
jgi:hypothetical protein